MDVDAYQRLASETDQRPGSDENALVFPLMGLASEVGSLITQYKKRVRDGDAHQLFTERVVEELGDVLWYVANLATKLGLSLDQIAEINLNRTRERWPLAGAANPPVLLDDGFPTDEQLPRKASVRFEEVEEHERTKVLISCEGVPMGNLLTDMNYDDDGYRFHDVFHLSYAALLGWSPLTRIFFGVRRESDSRVREVEDGGRAAVIEEAISAVVFNHARHERFFDGVSHVDFELLRTLIGLVSHLEVRVRTTAEWERAILAGYEVWRQVREHRGGVVHLDLIERRLSFEAP